MVVRLVPAQIKGARGMLDWSMVDLAKAAGLSVSTVKRVEAATPEVPSDNVHLAIRAAFETAGIRFLHNQGEGLGLRLKPR